MEGTPIESAMGDRYKYLYFAGQLATHVGVLPSVAALLASQMWSNRGETSGGLVWSRRLVLFLGPSKVWSPSYSFSKQQVHPGRLNDILNAGAATIRDSCILADSRADAAAASNHQPLRESQRARVYPNSEY